MGAIPLAIALLGSGPWALTCRVASLTTIEAGSSEAFSLALALAQRCDRRFPSHRLIEVAPRLALLLTSHLTHVHGVGSLLDRVPGGGVQLLLLAVLADLVQQHFVRPILVDLVQVRL